MKSFVKVMAVVFVAVLAVAATCENGGGVVSEADVSDLMQKEWILTEFKIGGETVVLDRSEMEGKGFGNFFTLTFTQERLGGKAAPNTYGAPYTLGEKQTVTIQPMVSTMMAPLFELDVLKENDYYQYLQSAYKWDFVKGQLEVFGKDGQGADVVLIFSLKADDAE